MDALVKGLLQGSIPTIVLVGGTHYLVKGFKVSRPVVYWGSLAVAAGLTYAVVQGKIKAPFMNAETFGADYSHEECFICSEPATMRRVSPSLYAKTQPVMGNEEGEIYFCDEHNNVLDLGLFSAGNLVAWTHPNGTTYLRGWRLKDAETFEA